MVKSKHDRLDPHTLLKREELSVESLRELIAIAEKANYTIAWWEKYGQPAFDRLEAVLEGPAENAGATLQQLMGVRGLVATYRIFPRGIVGWYDARIEVEATGAAR
jgi:hypothetical protein